MTPQTGVDTEILADVLELVIRLVIFFALAIASPFIGRLLPRLLWLLLCLSERLFGIDAEKSYVRFVHPFHSLLSIVGMFLAIAISLWPLLPYQDLYRFLGFFIYFALSATLAWFAFQFSRRLIHQSVIGLVQRWFGEVSEVVTLFETLVYVAIVVSGLLVFAIGLQVNVVALIASLGVGGVAIAFAARETLSRLFGTLEIYLDRPYCPGEYVRVSFNPYEEDTYGRIESVGLRSTKIRLVAQNTIAIVPNSVMAGTKIENISRGKKLVAMLCLDFAKVLTTSERDLVKQVIEEASRLYWGFNRASIRIQFCPSPIADVTRARAIFFLSGPDGSSLRLRKRLLELANSSALRKLANYNLNFTTPEPVVYIDSPMAM